MFAKKSSRIFVGIFCIFALLISLFIGGINLSLADENASAQSSNSFFKIELVKDTFIQEEIETINYEYSQGETATAHIFKASKIGYFKFGFDFSDEAISSWLGQRPSVDTKGTSYTTDDTYNLRIEVEFLKGYKNDGTTYFTDNSGLHAEVIVNKTLQTSIPITKNWQTEFNNYKPTFNVHDINIGENAFGQKTFTSWGIYRFKMVLGDNITHYSDFYILQPTMDVNTTPIITVNDDSLEEVVYQVSAAGDYKHIDPNQIVWYVHGETLDDKNYALLKSDLETEKFKLLECTEYLHTELPRTGYTFTLPRPTIDGEWRIWCEYTPYGQDNTTVSDDYYLIVGEQPQTLAPHWIVLIAIGAGIVLVGSVVAITIAVSVKHEKIY